MKKLAVFASGNGSNFEAICSASKQGRIKASVEILICDKKNAFVIERAKKYNIKTVVVSLKDFNTKEDYEVYIVNQLENASVDLICLAGYMKIIGSVLLNKYQGRIINIHPALLPSFKGANGILDAFNYGVKVFGVTVHYVNSGIDEGEIIMQRAFEYYGSDINEVEEKIHEIEHVLYIEAINKLIEE